MTHGKPQLNMGTERGGHTYLVQILTAGRAETDPRAPGRQSEIRDINKMRSLSSLEPRVPAFTDLSFLSGLLYTSGSRTFPLHSSVVRKAAISTVATIRSTQDRTPSSNSKPSAATKTRQPDFWTSPIISVSI